MKSLKTTKILILIILTQQLTSYSLQQLCKNQKSYNYQFHFGYPTLENTINASKHLGSGTFGDVYEINYQFTDQKKNILKTKVALKKVIVDNNSTTENIVNEISYMKEFSREDPKRFLVFYDCFYIQNEYHAITAVYMMTEKLSGDVETIEKDIYRLRIKKRYKIYLELIEDIRYFHANVKRKYLKNQRYVHMDIKVGNMMYKKQVDNSFRIKHIDYGLMQPLGIAVSLRGTPGYIHPELFKLDKSKKNHAYASDKLDVYAVMISIAQLEFGYKYGDIKNKCIDKMPKKCLRALKHNIFKGFCFRYQFPSSKKCKKAYKKNKELANSKRECDSLVCLIIREIQMKFSDTEDIERVYRQMKKLYEDLPERKIVLV